MRSFCCSGFVNVAKEEETDAVVPIVVLLVVEDAGLKEIIVMNA